MTSRHSPRLMRLLDALTIDQRDRYEKAVRESESMAEASLPDIVRVRLAERIRYGDLLPRFRQEDR